MRQKNKGEGTKIAQAAKELNVTSVTIRRYISEFEIGTMSDENGIKVLPTQAMEELSEIRRLKEEGLTNPKVMEFLEERRSKGTTEKPKAKDKDKDKDKAVDLPKEAVKKTTRVAAGRLSKKVVEEPEDESEEVPLAPVEKEDEAVEKEDDAAAAESRADGKSKYSLTCQTCNKTFEHMNPRLRDCLDCYRIKRKERRRGGGDKHKTVIQNPLAQQVLSKNQQSQQTYKENGSEAQEAISFAPTLVPAVEPRKISIREQLSLSATTSPPPAYQGTKVRSYRKAIEDTRQITSNLKRRLERPDLPESDRRFLEQIYAYQLILHQGWKHLAEYRSGGSGGDGPRSEG